MTYYQQAPELDVSGWLNTTTPITLEQLKGQVVLIHAFQMLCPACVSHGLPQAQAVHKLFENEKVSVIGLHTVFEHHQVMNKAALEAFVSEYRLSFPIAIDTASTQGVIPKTMHTYMLRGPPSIIVLDKQGNIRLNHFGRVSDLELGNLLGCFDDEGPKVPYIEGLKDGFDDGKIDSLGKVVGTADGSFDASLDGRKDGVMLGTPEG